MTAGLPAFCSERSVENRKPSLFYGLDNISPRRVLGRLRQILGSRMVDRLAADRLS